MSIDNPKKLGTPGREGRTVTAGRVERGAPLAPANSERVAAGRKKIVQRKLTARAKSSKNMPVGD
jgi:hypothetical protein